jgi:hypothetical protein
VFEHWGGDLDPHALQRASQAIDLDGEEAACPACGASFETRSARCPSCGLRLG